MSQKYFSVTKPDSIVTIVNDLDTFYQLSDGNMIKKDSFENKYQPVLEGFEKEHKGFNFNPESSDTLDPTAFFNSGSIPTDEITKIKSVDTTKVPDAYIPPVVKKVDENNQSIQPVQNTQVQNNIPQQPAVDPMIEINSQYDNELMVFGQAEAELRKAKRLNRLYPNNTQKLPTPPPAQQPQINPVDMMFSTFKRNFDISFNIEFTDKIGNPEFIKLMMENMDGDIIGYYKKLIMENIQNNIYKIEQEVENTLQLTIFGKKIDKEEIVKEDVVKLVEKKPRKPRTK
jgi:hypothetical protein